MPPEFAMGQNKQNKLSLIIMGCNMGYNINDIRSRYKELLENNETDIVGKLNDEFNEVIYTRNGKLYVDCSDFSSIDIEIT